MEYFESETRDRSFATYVILIIARLLRAAIHFDRYLHEILYPCTFIAVQ